MSEVFGRVRGRIRGDIRAALILPLALLSAAVSPWAAACTFAPPQRWADLVTSQGDITLSVEPMLPMDVPQLARGAAIQVIVENYSAAPVLVRPEDFRIDSSASCAARPAAVRGDLRAVRLPPGAQVRGVLRFHCMDEDEDAMLRFWPRSEKGAALSALQLPLPAPF